MYRKIYSECETLKKEKEIIYKVSCGIKNSGVDV